MSIHARPLAGVGIEMTCRPWGGNLAVQIRSIAIRVRLQRRLSESSTSSRSGQSTSSRRQGVAACTCAWRRPAGSTVQRLGPSTRQSPAYRVSERETGKRTKHGQKPYRFEEVVAWPFGDCVFNTSWALKWCAPSRLTTALYASLNGFSIRTPAMVAPCCMSSVSTCWQPLTAAACTINAS